jgi:pilus assembly protein CpaD
MDSAKRIFIRRHPFWRLYRRRIQFVVAAAVLAALASCAPDSTYWSPAESPKAIRVDWVRFDHAVAFDPRSNAMTPAARARLDEFLARVAPAYGDQLLVGTGAAPGAAGAAADRRVAAVAAYLRDRGLAAAALPRDPEVAWDGTVRLAVGRYVATPPRCPDWTKPADDDPMNRVASNWGCATATNLGLMVADPGDLVRGRTMGPADGEKGARGVKTYREGDKAAPPTITPLVIQSGVGTGGGGGQ